MGNIRPSFIKIRAIRLCEEYKDQFTDDFDTNKGLVWRFTDLVDEEGNVMNKRMRNWIAGYVTRYMQRRQDWGGHMTALEVDQSGEIGHVHHPQRQVLLDFMNFLKLNNFLRFSFSVFK